MILSPRLGRRRGTVLALLGALLAAACAARLLTGDVMGWPDGPILEIRLHRLAIGLAVGAALAVSGAVLQALLRNVLASPYILGLSSGATLGYVLAGFLPSAGWIAVARYGADQAAAFLGALVVMAVVYVLGQRRGRIDPVGLLLVGVVVNAINGAAIMFISFIAPPSARSQMTLWMLGYLADFASLPAVVAVGSVTLAGTLVASMLGNAMDVAVFSPAEAHSLGVRLQVLRVALFLLAGLLTASSVLVAGPIGFVGLICPHLVRLLIGPRHRPLILGSAMAGATLIVAADTLIKLLSDTLVPIGVVTALLGGPLFLVLLRPELGRGVEE